MSNIIKTVTLCTVLLATCFVQAQTEKHEWKTASDGPYTYSYVTNDPVGARFYKLKNGLSVILSVNKKLPRIQAYFSVKAGSKHDPEHNTGLAHYLEHLMFKGTDKFGTLDWTKESPLLARIDSLYEVYNRIKDPVMRKKIYSEIDQVSGQAAKYAIPNEYDKLINILGAEDVNAGTSYDKTVYHENIPNNAVDKYLAIQTERFRNPIFRLFHTELETVYEEKNMYMEDDFFKIIEQVFASLVPHHNYGKQTVIGSVEHLKNPSLKAIRDFYDRYYVPNNMAVVMAGDFNPSEMIKKIDQSFAFMKPKEITSYLYGKEQAIVQPIVREVFSPEPESLVLGFRFPGAASKDAQLLEVVAKMLTNGSAGLIDLNLVSAQKLLSAYAYPFVLKDYAVLLLAGHPSQQQNLDDVKKLLLDEIRKLRNGDFSDDLLASIVNNERKDKIVRNLSFKSTAEELSTAFANETDWLNVVGFIDQLAKITKQDVIDFANEYLTDKNYVVVYKRQGEDLTAVKMEKPIITPIQMNRNEQSPFLKTISEMPESAIAPVWVDYEKEVSKVKHSGLDVIAVQNKDNSLFSLSYKFPFGKWDSKMLPLALDYFNYLGTAKKSNESFKSEFYKMASSYATIIRDQNAYVTIAGLNENFEKTVALLHDLLINCNGNAEAFKAYILSVKKSRENAKEDKSIIQEGLQSYAVYGPNNPFNYILTDKELDALKEIDLLKILHDLTNTTHDILYYGPLSVNMLTENLPALKQSKTAYLIPERKQIFKEVAIKTNQVLFAHYKMAQVDISWHRTAGQYDSALEPLLSIFNTYFGGSMNSLVFQTIRESQGLAYSTYAFINQPPKKDGVYKVSGYVGTQPDKFKEASESMNKLLNNLPESQSSFSIAKSAVKKSLANNRITGEDILGNFLANEKLGEYTDIRKNHFEKIDQLNFEDVIKLHNEKLSKQPYTYYILGDRESLNMADLERLGTVKTLSLKEVFGY